MQRCPTCDFVYEEGQQLCDMDGAELFHDPNELPANQLVVRPKRRTRSIPRLITMVTLPNVLLAGLLVYGTTRQEAQTTQIVLPANKTRPSNIAPITPAEVSSPSATVRTESPEKPLTNTEGAVKHSDPSRDRTSTTDGMEPVSSPGVEPAKPAAVPGEPKPATGEPIRPRATAPGTSTPQKSAQQKKDSKVSSLLKKTGRFLKRPFED